MKYYDEIAKCTFNFTVNKHLISIFILLLLKAMHYNFGGDFANLK